jgi:hypothetical protein
VGPGTGLGRCGKSRPTGIRSSDLPARSESLYRIRYPGSHLFGGVVVIRGIPFIPFFALNPALINSLFMSTELKRVFRFNGDVWHPVGLSVLINTT